MPVQKRRLGRTRIHHRRSAWMRNAGHKVAVNACPNCGEPRVPHRVCGACGFYNGKQVVEIQAADEE